MTGALSGLVTHRYADLEDARLHYVETGEGPLVVLLHGFPQFWYMWRFQIPALVQAGFRVVAPDMRGYNLSNKPPKVSDYQVELLARDVERLIRACGEETATVAGHDWGAMAGWVVAMMHPERVERLGILNLPHPHRFARGLLRPAQLLRSSYMFFFQIPSLPEKALGASNFASLRYALRNEPVRPETFSTEDIDRYTEALARPGALTAALNYYRALFRRNPFESRRLLQRIEAPVLVIWGEKDRVLGADLAEPDRYWVPNLRMERLPDAGHFVAEDRPEKVNALLLDFLGAPIRVA